MNSLQIHAFIILFPRICYETPIFFRGHFFIFLKHFHEIRAIVKPALICNLRNRKIRINQENASSFHTIRVQILNRCLAEEITERQIRNKCHKNKHMLIF